MLKRIIIALGILGLLNFYVVSRSAQRWHWARPHAALLVVGGGAILALLLAGPLGDRRLLPALRRKYNASVLVMAVDWASYAAFGLWSCLLFFTFVADIVCVVWRFVAAPVNAVDFDRRVLFTLAAAAFANTAAGIRQAIAGPRVKVVEIPLDNLPPSFDGFKIVQVSDLHVSSLIGALYTTHVVATVNELQPDLVALTGDFVDGSVADLATGVEPLASLKAPDGIYFITGNHEYYWDADAWIREFRRLGARVLLNEHVLVRREADEIILAGVTDYSTINARGSHASSPKRAFEGAPAGKVRILLAHQPNSYRMASEAGVDLQLSGHTHAGQYFPFTLLIGFFQRYYKGLNRHEETWIYVNSGTGFWGPPLRTCAPSEITLIILRCA